MWREFFLLLFGLFFFFFLHFPRGGATAQDLKSEAAVEDRKEMADRVPSLQAHLGNRALENCVPRDPPLWYEYECFFCLALFLSFLPSFVLST